MSNNIGQRVANIEADQPWLPITQVKVNAGDNTYIAGTTTGRTFEVDCPIGSQAVADNSRLRAVRDRIIMIHRRLFCFMIGSSLGLVVEWGEMFKLGFVGAF